MTAFVVILAIRGRADLGNDHVDGLESPQIPIKKNHNTSHKKGIK